ncbi:hypothetical protein RND71_042848 [Anisodus tanguticus]|uniref:Uncharacterized protein n=1 Tax=Anisodus tanguticus TaxID=243964 RepID=A0AAE1QRR9_9SOLA|nr:hypothetical protein RND71_042848 [Anisodus tanguticus]
MKNDDQERFLFGISLFDRPKWQQFLICSSGFFSGYLVNGLCENVSAVLFVGGLIFFTLADANTSPNFSIIGVIMITGAMVMDSFLGNLNPDTSQVTTARKAVTLLLSYLIFTKPLTEQHCSGLLLISMGVFSRLLPDSKPSPRAVKSDNTTKRSHHKEANLSSENIADEEETISFRA